MKYFLLFFALLISESSLACQCMYAGKFSEYTSHEDIGIVRAKVMSYGAQLSFGSTLYESMAVEVLEVIKGKYSHRDLYLLGDPGNLCRDYVDSKRFSIGSEHFISIANQKLVQPLGGCGESSVIIQDGRVNGIVIENEKYIQYSADLDEFIEEIK